MMMEIPPPNCDGPNSNAKSPGVAGGLRVLIRYVPRSQKGTGGAERDASGRIGLLKGDYHAEDQSCPG